MGNELIALFGARAVHPVGVSVGGFHHAPSLEDVAAMRVRLHAARADAEALVRWTAKLPLPDDEQDFISVAMRHPDEYAIHRGRLVTSLSHDLDITEFEQHFQESHAPHSTALHAHLDGKPYLVGPLARMNLNYAQMPADLRGLLESLGFRFPSRNMFHSIVARAAEVWLVVDEAERLLSEYQKPVWAVVDFERRVFTGSTRRVA